MSENDRIQLNDMESEEIVGGAFVFQYNSKGQYACKVDGFGTFFADESAKRKINMHDVQSGGLTTAELVEWAISEHLLWRP